MEVFQRKRIPGIHVKRSTFGTLVVILLLFVGWVLSEAIHATSSRRGAGLDYLEFRKTMPIPWSARVFTVGEDDYIALFGPIRSPLAFPSGPPVYIFDENGRFVDWVFDSGDTPRFAEMWLTNEGRQVSIDEADQIVLQRNRGID